MATLDCHSRQHKLRLRIIWHKAHKHKVMVFKNDFDCANLQIQFTNSKVASYVHVWMGHALDSSIPSEHERNTVSLQQDKHCLVQRPFHVPSHCCHHFSVSIYHSGLFVQGDSFPLTSYESKWWTEEILLYSTPIFLIACAFLMHSLHAPDPIFQYTSL